AMTLADRMIVMNAGRADQIGAPLEVYADPATEFVAGFIGSPATNFLAGRDGGRIGVRPEHARLAAPGHGLAEGTVQFAEALGAETLLHLRLATGEPFTIRQDGTAPVPPEGSACAVTWDRARELAFGTDGRRVR
ncbi:MAG: TOBE domain-containing protein, partial [Pseudooceanicola sp.]|nr:TOBE domain-containing protein [Pseudooceanicola sp.]